MYNVIKGGKYMDIQGIRAYLPFAPGKREVDNWHLPKKEQFFRRTPLPEFYYERREEESYNQEKIPGYVNSELESFRRQEWHRRLNGYWFMNYGKPTYMTGLHYFYCNWWKCDFGYPDFRIPDMELFYFLQYCIEDPYCLGINELTLRRDGKTARAGCFLYEHISRTSNVYGGIQSKTDADGKKVFLKSVVLPWENLPDFFRPVYDYNSTQKKEIRFFEPGVKGKQSLERLKRPRQQLQSIIDYKSSGIYAYDGEKLSRMIVDETGKTEEVNVWERHDVLMPCFEEWGKGIIGKMYNTTTVEDMEVIGDGYKKLRDNSRIDNRDQNGRTISGLYNYFKPAFRGYMYNLYGYAMEEEGKRYYLAALESRKHDARMYSSYKRKHPFTEEDAFMVDGDKCEFNAMILNERLSELNVSPHLVSRGDFIWKDGIEPDGENEGKVVFVHNKTSGRFKVAWLPEEDSHTNLVRRGRVVKGIPQYYPLNDQKFAMATDPIDHGVTVDGRRSNAATYVFRKFDLLVDDPEAVDSENRLDWQTHNFVVQYIHRPNEPTQYYDAMIRLCYFFGCQLLAENQKRGIITHFQQKGFGAFIMNRPKETFTAKNNTQDTPGIPSSKPMIQQYTGKLQTYVEYHGHRIPFKELVIDLLQFDPNKPTKHDATVAAGFTIIASEKQTVKPIETTGGMSYVQYYDNSGNRSRPIRE